MSLGREIRDALQPGTVSAEIEGRQAEVEVRDVDRLGVSVERIRVAGGGARITEQATRLPDALRPLPERIVPVEVAPELGGAILRSDPADIVDREYFEVHSDANATTVERYQAHADGRARVPFTLTHEQLGRVIDGIGEAREQRD